MLTLHVTNGDHAAAGLARSGLRGDVLSWRDILHDGPVPPDLPPSGDLDRFRVARARFLAASMGVPEDDVVADFEARDARLAEALGGAASEIVLWFEPDLYDQLQLAQVLARIASAIGADASDGSPRLSIVPADLLLGPLDPPKFVPLFEARRALRGADIAQGAAAWAAFTSPSPEPLAAMVTRLDREVPARTYADDDDARLPFMAAALRRQLEEYPGSDNGLSRTERQACERLATGATTLGRLYRDAHHASESWTWLGDSTFAWYMERLSDCAQPVIVLANGSRVVAPRQDGEARAFWERTVRLTEFGEEVVRCRADAVQANGIDRWIGGVHLTAQRYWRWNARTGTADAVVAADARA